MRTPSPSAATVLLTVLLISLLGGWWWSTDQSADQETSLIGLRPPGPSVPSKSPSKNMVSLPAPAIGLTSNSLTPPTLDPREIQLPPPLKLAQGHDSSPDVVLFRDATLVSHRVAPADANGQVRRLEVYRTPSFKFPLLRVEAWFQPVAAGEAKLLRREISVADHVMVRFPADLDDAKVRAWAVSKGFTLRKKLRSAPVYLIGTSQSDVDAADVVMTAYRESFPALANKSSYAERDFVVSASVTPNDPSFPTLWGLHNTGQSSGVVDADIDAPEAWDIATGSRSTLVGIIDTGFDRTHADLAANAWTNPREVAGNGIDDDLNGYVDDVRGWDFYNNDSDPMDDNKHGTHCAGTIGAVGGNGAGLAGVCWEVSIVGLKFLSASGSGATSDAVEAVNYSTQIGVAMTSNSWGGGGSSQALKDAIEAAGTAGIIFVVAAGNSAANTDSLPSYPASYPSANIVSVASTTRADALSSFSNFGVTSVDLGAPGSEIYSTVLNGGYALLSGTSMATPHVTGALALVKSIAPQLTVAQLKQNLLSTVDPLPALSGRTASGGRLNVGRFMQQSAGPVPVISNTQIAEGSGSNKDGVLNPGESFTIAIGVTNRGTETASNITATLTLPPSSSYSVSENTITIGTLEPGAAASPLSAFALRSPSGLSTPHEETLTITLTYGAPLKSNQFTLPIRVNTTAHISGFVTEQSTSQPLARATISYDGPTSGVVTCDEAGAYQFTAVDGAYSIQASASGWLPSLAQTVTAPPDRSGVNFALRLPNLDLRPSSISLNLNAGDIATPSLLLANRGSIPLVWRLELFNEFTARDQVFHLPPVALTSADPDRPSATQDDTNNAAIVPMSAGLDTALGTLTGIKIGFLAESASVSLISADVAARGATVVTLSPPLSASALAGVQVVVVDDTVAVLSSNDVSTLRSWLQNGGGLLTEGDNLTSMVNLNTVLAGSGLVATSHEFLDLTLTDVRSHSITKGITSVFEAAAGASFTLSGAASPLLVEDSGAVHAAVSRLGLGRVVAVGNEITASSNFGTGQARQCANQMIDSLALTKNTPWVLPSVSSGSIAVGSSGRVDLAINTEGLITGTYQAHGVFYTNDPLAPEVRLPITVTVRGTPSLRVNSEVLNHGHVVEGTDSERTLAISNPGTDSLTVTKLTLRGKGAASFVVNPSGAINIDPGGTQNVKVVFVGSALGDYTAELVISSNAPSSPEKIIVLQASRVLAPRLTVSPDESRITIRQGDKSTVSFTVGNAGKGTLDWTALIAGNVPPGAKLSLTSGSLAPGKRAQVALTIDATGWKFDRTLFLRFISQNSGGPPLSRVVDITVVPAAVLEANPRELQIEDTFVFGKSTRNLSVVNTGLNRLVVKGAFCSNPAFSISAKWPLVIEPGGFTNVTVTFRPTKVGTASGSLLFTSNAPTVRTAIPVSGQALPAPQLSLSSSSLSLSVVPGSAATRTVSIQNKGGNVLNWAVKATQINGPVTASIVRFPSSSGTTAVGTSSTLDLDFETSALTAGTYNYALDFTSNDPRQPTLRYPIKITVQSLGWIKASPAAMSFPDTAVGGHREQELVLTNPGNLPVEIRSIAFDSRRFGLGAVTVPAVIDAGQELRFKVNFAPTTPGEQRSTLRCVTTSNLTPFIIIENPRSQSSCPAGIARCYPLHCHHRPWKHLGGTFRPQQHRRLSVDLEWSARKSLWVYQLQPQFGRLGPLIRPCL